MGISKKSKQDTTAQIFARKMLEVLGIQMAYGGLTEYYPSVSGKALVMVDSYNDITGTLFHELGHWIAASPEYRERKGYGLNGKETGRTLIEDHKATLVAFWINERLGRPIAFDAGRQTLEDYNFQRALVWWTENHENIDAFLDAVISEASDRMETA